MLTNRAMVHGLDKVARLGVILRALGCSVMVTDDHHLLPCSPEGPATRLKEGGPQLA